MQLTTESFVPLMDSPIHVRWTSPAYAVLDAALLDTIKPLSGPAAATAFSEAERRVRGLNTHRRVPDAEVLDLGSASAAQTQAWIEKTLGKKRRPRATDEVVASWDDAMGVVVSWATFAPNWQTFFRPGEDVTVFPAPPSDWTIFYHHGDKLFIG